MSTDYSEMDTSELARQAARLGALADLAKTEADEARGALKARLAALGSWTFGSVEVKLSSNTRFDAALAKKNLSPAKYKKICAMVPTTALAKAMHESGQLTDEDLTKCKKVFDPKLTITIKG